MHNALLSVQTPASTIQKSLPYVPQCFRRPGGCSNPCKYHAKHAARCSNLSKYHAKRSPRHPPVLQGSRTIRDTGTTNTLRFRVFACHSWRCNAVTRRRGITAAVSASRAELFGLLDERKRACRTLAPSLEKGWWCGRATDTHHHPFHFRV
jgi:hypothetical protein